jgi:outer membrane protein OmpU
MHKKILTILMAGSVSLLAMDAAAKAATATDASGPSIKTNGVFRSLLAVTNQKVRTNKGSQMMTYGNVTFNAGGTANNGLTYGALIVLEADRNKNTNSKIGDAYTYVGSDAIGSFQLGDVSGVTSLMMYDGSDVMGGTGGFDANLEKQLNVTRGVAFDQSIGYVNDGSNRATKLTYMSPEVAGYQVGVSYVPSTAQYGRSVDTRGLDSTGKLYSGSAPYAVNQTEGAVSFTDDIGAYTLGFYLTGTLGKSKAPNSVAGTQLNPVKAWQFGSLIDYENWQFGVGYFDNGKSYMRRNTKFTNTHGFNLAMSYGMGPMSLALGYTGTERTVTSGKAKADISSFTVDYSVADGLAVYGEASYFKFRAPVAHLTATSQTAGANGSAAFVPAVDYLDRQPSSNGNNNGTAFILGTRVNF